MSASTSVPVDRVGPALTNAGSAEAFIRSAEAATNAYDVERASSVYAPDATLETVTDGAHEVHTGLPAIRVAWAGYLGGFEAEGLRLAKRLVSSADDTIVNEWSGVGPHCRARGIEVWRLSTTGEVVEHRLFTFLDVRPSDGLLARLRLAVIAPRLAVGLLRAKRRAEKTPLDGGPAA